MAAPHLTGTIAVIVEAAGRAAPLHYICRLLERSLITLEVIATASKPFDVRLRAGDWIVRWIPGAGDIGHISILPSDELLDPSILAAAGVASESDQRGRYGIVIEAGANPHTRSRPFARRPFDGRGRLPPHTVFLRAKFPEEGRDGEQPLYNR